MTVSGQLQSAPVFVDLPTRGQLSKLTDRVGEQAEETKCRKSKHIFPQQQYKVVIIIQSLVFINTCA